VLRAGCRLKGSTYFLTAHQTKTLAPIKTALGQIDYVGNNLKCAKRQFDWFKIDAPARG